MTSYIPLEVGCLHPCPWLSGVPSSLDNEVIATLNFLLVWLHLTVIFPRVREILIKELETQFYLELRRK